MIAVLLVGGEGTRLRPLTEWLPKPMLPIANRPFLEHQIEHLRLHGVKRVVMACGYLHQSIRDHFGDESTIGSSPSRWAPAAPSASPPRASTRRSWPATAMCSPTST